MTESYDIETVYDERISPLMAQIIEICKEVDMPMIATFGYAYDADDDVLDLCTSSLPGRDDPKGVVEKCFKIIKRDYDVIPNTIAFMITSNKRPSSNPGPYEE